MHDSKKRDEDAPVDPIALTLAVWLGLIVGVNGLVRLSERAEFQASVAQAGAKTSNRQSVEVSNPFSARLMAFGG